MFTTQYTQNDGGRAVAMAMLPPPPTKPITQREQVPKRASIGAQREEVPFSMAIEYGEIMHEYFPKHPGMGRLK